jgi:DNA-directed RNA polymerase specialized sigma24 family protein
MGVAGQDKQSSGKRGSVPVTHNVFPPTLNTWIEDRLGAGEDGRRDVNRHLMDIYYEPLQVYYKGTSWRAVWEPHDAVAGFFENRLRRLDFVEKWRQSGLPLRKWLMTAINLYLLERWRSEKRAGAAGALDVEPAEPDGGVGGGGAPARGLTREYIRTVAQHALVEAQRACEDAGLAQHWEVFFTHEVRRLPYARIAEQLSIARERCVVMDRTARGKYVAAIRQAVAADLPPGTDVDDEIRRVLEEAGA